MQIYVFLHFCIVFCRKISFPPPVLETMMLKSKCFLQMPWQIVLLLFFFDGVFSFRVFTIGGKVFILGYKRGHLEGWKWTHARRKSGVIEHEFHELHECFAIIAHIHSYYLGNSCSINHTRYIEIITRNMVIEHEWPESHEFCGNAIQTHSGDSENSSSTYTTRIIVSKRFLLYNEIYGSILSNWPKQNGWRGLCGNSENFAARVKRRGLKYYVFDLCK